MRTGTDVSVQSVGVASTARPGEAHFTTRKVVLLAAIGALALAVLGRAWFAMGAGDSYPEPIAVSSE